MERKRKDQEFIIEEIPGDGDLGELLAMSIVEYINDKYGREVVSLKPKHNTKTIKVKMTIKVDKNIVDSVRLRR